MSYRISNSRLNVGKQAIETEVRFAPSSTYERLIFPLKISTKEFQTTTFSNQWAEGKISLQEIRQVLNNLKDAKGYNSFGPSPLTPLLFIISGFAWFICSALFMSFFGGSEISFLVPFILFFINAAYWFYLSRKIATQNEEVQERQRNLDEYLKKTDPGFEPRGLRFRAGTLGAWISLSKIIRVLELAPQDDGKGVNDGLNYP